MGAGRMNPRQGEKKISNKVGTFFSRFVLWGDMAVSMSVIELSKWVNVLILGELKSFLWREGCANVNWRKTRKHPIRPAWNQVSVQLTGLLLTSALVLSLWSLASVSLPILFPSQRILFLSLQCIQAMPFLHHVFYLLSHYLEVISSSLNFHVSITEICEKHINVYLRTNYLWVYNLTPIRRVKKLA